MKAGVYKTEAKVSYTAAGATTFALLYNVYYECILYGSRGLTRSGWSLLLRPQLLQPLLVLILNEGESLRYGSGGYYTEAVFYYMEAAGDNTEVVSYFAIEFG